MKQSPNLIVLFAILGMIATTAQAAGSEWKAADKEKWDNLVKESGEFYEKQEYDHAIAVEKQALDLAEKNVGIEHRDTAENYNALGLFFSLKKDYTKAELHLNRALDVFEKLSDSKGKRDVLENMCEMYNETHNLSKIEEFCRQNFEANKKVYGAEDPSNGKAMATLGLAYFADQKFDKAEPLLTKALAIAEKDSPNSENVGMLSGFLGTTYLFLLDFKKAEKYLAYALPMREKSLGANNPVVAKMMHNLASAYAEQGKFDEAIPLYERATEAEEKILPSNHPETASTLYSLGVAHAAQKQFDKAVPVLLRSLTIYEKIDTKGKAIALVLDKLVYSHAMLGEFDKAETYNVRELDLFEKNLGAENPQTIIVRKQLEKIKQERINNSAKH